MLAGANTVAAERALRVGLPPPSAQIRGCWERVFSGIQQKLQLAVAFICEEGVPFPVQLLNCIPFDPFTVVLEVSHHLSHSFLLLGLLEHPQNGMSLFLLCRHGPPKFCTVSQPCTTLLHGASHNLKRDCILQALKFHTVTPVVITQSFHTAVLSFRYAIMDGANLKVG